MFLRTFSLLLVILVFLEMSFIGTRSLPFKSSKSLQSLVRCEAHGIYFILCGLNGVFFKTIGFLKLPRLTSILKLEKMGADPFPYIVVSLYHSEIDFNKISAPYFKLEGVIAFSYLSVIAQDNLGG